MDMRTDLAVEALQQAGMGMLGQLSGVEQEEKELAGGLTSFRVKILNEEGSQQLGKPIGEYITLDAPGLSMREATFYETLSNELAGCIRSMLTRIDGEGPVLVVGLGNAGVTPDSLGPRVVSNVLITRHIAKGMLPKEIDERLNPVCAMAPGVLGLTGIETAEIVRGVVERVAPRLVIAIDSLAARSTSRIAASVQVSDTGIKPGSGIGNRRAGIDSETLGVPVVAVGMPMVVYATTIAHDVMQQVLEKMGAREEDAEAMLGMVTTVAKQDMPSLVVTPKEVDELVESCASMIADGVNLALHNGLNLEDVRRFMM